jgi:dTDP-4-dehydrorhamnose reductase
MKILITGMEGQIGRELTRMAQEKKFDYVPFNHQRLDITDFNAVEKTLTDYRPSVVINAAAYTAVDKAEFKTERARVFEINQEGPFNLAVSCKRLGAALIHISTDYVFDGLKKGPYREMDPIAPLGFYGTSKASGETAVRDTLTNHIIVRTAWVFSAYGHNFVKTMLRLGCEKETLRVVNDQSGCPTYAGDIAEALLTIASYILSNSQNSLWGTYHYCGQGVTTWYGFAQAIFEHGQKYFPLKIKKLIPITTEEYPTPAQRPRNSVLDCTAIKQCFGINPVSWEKGLVSVIEELYLDKNLW